MITSIMAFVVIRQIFLMIVLNLYHDMSIIGWGYSLTWMLAAAFTAYYYFHSHWLQVEESRNQI